MNEEDFQKSFEKFIDFKTNEFHPLVRIGGNPQIGNNVNIGFFSEINAKDSKIQIGDDCDIASFVAINSADSHSKCIGIAKEIIRKEIILENNVFVGSHCVIKGGAYIGHHSVIASGTVVDGVHIPPYSLVSGNPMKIKKNYYSTKTTS